MYQKQTLADWKLFFYHMDEELLQCLTYRSYRGARAPKKHTKEKVLNSNNLLIYYTTICKDLLVLLSPPVCSLPIGKPFSVSTSVPPLAIMLVLLSLPT